MQVNSAPTISQGSSEEANTLDVRFHWTVLRKRKWVMLATVATSFVAALAWTLRQPKVYQATATVIIDPQAPKVLGKMSDIVELGASNFWGNQDYYTTQYRVLKSKWLARRVVRKHDLHRDARIVGPTTRSGSSEEDLVELATNVLKRSIRVLPVKDSRVVGIAFRSTYPELARDLANFTSRVYMEQNVAVKVDATRGASRWVATQLDEAREQLGNAETALYEFKRENNILSLSLEDRQNMISNALEEFGRARSQAKTKRIDLLARRRAISRLLTGSTLNAPSSYVSVSDGIEASRKSHLQEKSKLVLLQERYGPKHPEVIYQQSRVASALADLKKEAATLVSSVAAEIDALADSEQGYRAEIDRLKVEALDLNEKEISYKRLLRVFDNSKTVYALLHTRLNESGLQAEDHANNIRILDEANAPMAHIEPNLKNSLLLASVLGIILALGLAFFIEFLDRSVKTQEDVESVIGLPFLGMVPSIEPGRLERDLYVHEHAGSTVAECCRVVRTNLLFSSPDKPLKTIVVTSSNAAEGKTITVINLGIVMAQGGHRTLLVDTDMRRPRLHKVFGASAENGVSRLVVGESTVEDAVKTTEVKNLFVLPCGPIPPNPAELLQTDKFAQLIDELSERYDRIVFDSPPVLAVTDSAILSRSADGVVFVVRAVRTPRELVIRAKRLVQGVNGRIVGVVLNDVNLRSPQYQAYYNQYQYRYYDTPATAIDGAKKG